jgi:hypothetical protein
MKMFDKRILGRIFGPRRDEVTGGGENCIIRSFIICFIYKSRRMRFEEHASRWQK